jgi:hypothetical protein
MQKSLLSQYKGPVYMRPVRKSHNFQLILLARQFSFLDAFVSMCCSNVKVTAETGLKCICVYIHPSLNSCRSEVSRLGPAGGMTWDRSELFSSRSHVNIYYKLLYDRNEMVPVWLRSGLMYTGPKNCQIYRLYLTVFNDTEFQGCLGTCSPWKSRISVLGNISNDYFNHWNRS